MRKDLFMPFTQRCGGIVSLATSHSSLATSHQPPVTLRRRVDLAFTNHESQLTIHNSRVTPHFTVMRGALGAFGFEGTLAVAGAEQADSSFSESTVVTQ